MKHVLQITSVTIFILFAAMSEASTMRAQDIDQETWGKVFAGQLKDFLIEFRQGDTLPVSVTAEGDFFETAQAQTTPLKMKKDVWMKVDGTKYEFSLDGKTFKPLPQVAQGSFSIGATANDSSGGRATGINMNLKAYQK